MKKLSANRMLVISPERPGTDPAELLSARDAAAVYDLVSLIHVAISRPNACALLERRFHQLAVTIKPKYLPGLRSLRAEVEGLALAWGRSDSNATVGDRLSVHGCDEAAQRLAALLPLHDLPGGREEDSVASALREVLAPAITVALKVRLTAPDQPECAFSPPSQQSCADYCAQGILRFDEQGMCEFRNDVASRILKRCGSSVRDGIPLAVKNLVKNFVADPQSSVDPCSFKAGDRRVQAVPLIVERHDGSRFLQLFLFAEETNSTIAKRLIRRAALSRQEAAVLRYLLDGLTNGEIGGAMDLSVHTVRTYVERIYQKLGVTSRHELLTLGAIVRDRFASGEE